MNQPVERPGAGPALSLRRVLALALLVYAIGLPVMLWLHAGYKPVQKPSGQQTELLLKFRPSKDGSYSVQTFAFARLSDDAPLRVYEDLAPLDAGKYATSRVGEARLINLSSSDGTDPNSNGRRYWAVRP